MRITARGWSRDHGEKEIIDADIVNAPVKDVLRYTPGETYLEVPRPTELYRGQVRTRPPRVVISRGVKLSLGGEYLVQVHLSRNEIARLFYETNRDRKLETLVELFSSFESREREEEEEAASSR